MKRVVFLLLAVLNILLFARENPFEPIIAPHESGKVADTPEPSYFTPQSLQLPSSARKIKRILIEYQNMDGSVDTINKALDNEIDWHFPLVVLQQISRSNEKVELKTEELKEIKEAVEKKESPKITQKKEIKPLSFLSFEIEDKELFIRTKDSIIRDFALAEPTKIVIDFDRIVSFKSRNIETNATFYKIIALGNHDKYYRVAIELDGKYRYKLEKQKEGYKITLE